MKCRSFVILEQFVVPNSMADEAFFRAGFVVKDVAVGYATELCMWLDWSCTGSCVNRMLPLDVESRPSLLIRISFASTAAELLSGTSSLVGARAFSRIADGCW